MQRFRPILVAACLVAFVGSGVALAQTTPSPTPPSSTGDDVSKWTKSKYDEMKAKWAQEKAKWADCQKQAKDQKDDAGKQLRGRKRWAFLYQCMTK